MGSEGRTPPSGSRRDDVEITQRDGFVEVQFSGEFNPAAAMEVVDLMVAACDETGCSRVLLDCRRMTGPLSVVDRFEVAEYGSQVIERHVTVAMLARPDQILPDQFFEKVAVSRGVRVRVFTDRSRAVSSLR
jgi:hypothetical protein